MQEIWSLGQEDPLEKGMTSYSSVLVWRIPWIEEPGGLQSIGLQRVRHDWATKHMHILTSWKSASFSHSLDRSLWNMYSNNCIVQSYVQDISGPILTFLDQLTYIDPLTPCPHQQLINSSTEFLSRARCLLFSGSLDTIQQVLTQKLLDYWHIVLILQRAISWMPGKNPKWTKTFTDPL